MNKILKVIFYGVLVFIGMTIVLSIVYPTLSATVMGRVVVGGCGSENVPQMCVDSRVDIFKLSLGRSISVFLSGFIGTEFGCSAQEEYLVCE